MDLKLSKVANDNPTGILVVRKIPHITAGLLLGSQPYCRQTAYNLCVSQWSNFFVQSGCGYQNIAVNKTGMSMLPK